MKLLTKECRTINLNEVVTLFHDKDRLIRLEIKGELLFDIKKDCAFTAFLRYLAYHDRLGRLSTLLNKKQEFCGHRIMWTSILDIFMFIEIFKDDYTHILVCYTSFDS